MAIDSTSSETLQAKLRILHVIPGVASRYGGPSTAIWPMTKAVREIGMEVEVATTDADGPYGRISKSDLPDDVGTVHIFRRDQGENLKYSRDLGLWLESHARDYDVIHAHSNWNYPIAAACRAARRAEVPYILRPCGMMSEYTWRKARWKKRIYWWLKERKNVLHAAGFHVTSVEEREEVLRLGVTSPVEVIPLAVGEDAWDAVLESSWLREQFPQAGKRPILLFLSRMHPKKGITDILLPAFALLKTDAFLAIVGGVDDHAPGYTNSVEREINRLGLRDRAALLGELPPSRRWAAFDGADLFVLPSHSENFGLVVAEAMARGKPVVVTRGVQFAEHVTASGAGSVTRFDSTELALVLDSWLSDPARRVQAGQAGQRYIQCHLTWRRTAERLAELYRSVRTH